MKKEKEVKDRYILDKNKIRKRLRIDNQYIDNDLPEIFNIFTTRTMTSTYNNIIDVHMNAETAIKERKKRGTTDDDTINNMTKQMLFNLYRRVIHYTHYDYTKDYKIKIDEFDNMFNKLHITPAEYKCLSRTKLSNKKIVLTILKKYGLNFKTEYKRQVINKKRINTPLYYTITPDPEYYKVLYLEVSYKKGYDERFINLVNTFDTYKDLMINKNIFKNP